MTKDKDLYEEDLKEIRNCIIGFGEASLKKSYYPQLQYQREELERFRAALDSTRDIVFILDPFSGRIIDANSRAEETLGYSTKELLNMTICDIAHHDQLHHIITMMTSGIRSSKLIRALVIKRNGQETRMELSFSSAHLEKDCYITVLCRDIAEREAMEAAIRYSEFQYRTTINALHDILVVIDGQSHVIIYNDAFETLCRNSGITEEIQGMELRCLSRVFSSGREAERHGSFFHDEYFEEDIIYRYKGKFAVYSLRNMPIVENGVFKQSVLCLRDTTEYTVLEDIKKEAFVQIEKNMEQFAVLNDRIRNPLQVILGIIDLECGEEVTEKIVPYINEIDDLIKGLDVGWIESEKVRNMIVKHYGISLIDRSDISDVIRYLQDKCAS